MDRVARSIVVLFGCLSPVVATALGQAALGQALPPVQRHGLAVALAAVSAGPAPVAPDRRPPSVVASPGRLPSG